MNLVVDKITNKILGNRDVLTYVVDNFDWFIVKDDYDHFTTIPVWTLCRNYTLDDLISVSELKDKKLEKNRYVDRMKTIIKPVVWLFPTELNIDKDKEYFCGKAYCMETNAFVKDFEICKDLAKHGYNVCGFSRGAKIEQYHPVLSNFEKPMDYSAIDRIQDIAIRLAEKYGEKITEQYKAVLDKKRPYKQIDIDINGVAYTR